MGEKLRSMFRSITLPALAAVLLAAFFSCKKSEQPDAGQLFQKNKTADIPGQMAHDWVDLGHQMVKENHLFAPQAARIYGYLGLALYESTVHGIPGGRSLAGQVNDLNALPLPDFSQEYDWGIVMCAAMKTIMPVLVDGISDQQKAEIRSLASIQQSDMTAKHAVPPLVEKASVDFGIRIADKIIARIKSDGRDIIRNIVPQLPARDALHPQYWDMTTLNQTAIEPLWSTVRSFVLPNSQGCETDPPLPFNTVPTGNFFKEAKEVFSFYPLGFEQKAVVYHWEDGPGRSATAAGHWMNIAEQVLVEKEANLAESCKTYALVGMAVADAASAAWYQKYKFNLLRPITFIRENISADWVPAINTPAYPSHISASAAVGGAAATVLNSLFGEIKFIDRTHFGSAIYTPDEPGVPKILPERAFSSFKEASEEAAESRILGGVDFRRSASLGLESGRCAGLAILEGIDFQE